MANSQDGSLFHQGLGGSAGQITPAANMPRTMRLDHLIDVLIQRAYHDLLVLAEVELVSRSKSDMDKKIAIMMYLSRTRNYFIRFLALLEWSSSMSKVDKCFSIISYLEEQSALFVETADVLARMSRETLANSKLPCYQVSFAVDVLNSRSCPRMPSCIKDKIVPPDPLTEEETEETLKELGFALWNRLITTDRPPPEMRNYVVRKGRVIFTVEKEFQVTLTVMGEDKTMPFRILDLKILVKNRRVGEGRPLVHPQQVMYLIQLLQSRIVDNEKPLDEVYDLLHTFCQSLKLEVLYSQLSKHMVGGRLDFFRIESYSPGRELKISYWNGANWRKGQVAPSVKTYSVVISADSTKRDLTVTQAPPIDASLNLVDLEIGILLISIIHFRVKNRISKLENELSKSFFCSSTGFPYVLTVPLYSGSPRAHSVQISIDYYTGNFLVFLQQFPSKFTQSLKEALDAPVYKLEKIVEILRTIRLELVLKLATTSAMYLLMQEPQKINLYGGQAVERYNQLGPFKTVFRFQKKTETTALLGISCHEDASQPDSVRIDFHILMVEETKLGTKVLSLTSMRDIFAEKTTEKQANFSKFSQKNSIELLRVRLKSMKEFRGDFSRKKTEPRRFYPIVLDNFEQMIHHVMLQIMFAELRTALKAKNYTADATVLDPLEGGHSLCCLTLPVRASHPLVRSCVFRRVCKLHTNPNPSFHVDVVVSGVPFQKCSSSTADEVVSGVSGVSGVDFQKSSSSTAHCTFSYDTSLSSEKMIDAFDFDWISLLGLLRLMRRFKCFLETKPDLAKIKFKIEFNLKNVTILYGPDLELRMFLSWDRKEEKLLLEFHGEKGGIWNPHRMLKGKLMELICQKNGKKFQISENGKKSQISKSGKKFHVLDFSHIFDILAQTTPIALAVRDSVRPVGILKTASRTLTPQVAFQFIPLSLSQFVVIWKGIFCLNFKVLSGPKFVVTDVGATDSVRKNSESETRFSQIPNLKSIVESALGQNNFSDGEIFDQDLQISILRFFSRLRGFSVHVTSTSTFSS